ncbi:MAG TPA: LysM peptidoglycan-binding domain-containing protein, partial [Chitinophagaceae bacterium]|nr:LysM peptidoglycan-binding domain-containing protein [Chitinophagaceae bacterium]
NSFNSANDNTKPEENNQDAQSKKENDNFITYTVQPKETIWAIAQKFKTSIDNLVKWNHLSGYDLRSGQQLKINK